MQVEASIHSEDFNELAKLVCCCGTGVVVELPPRPPCIIVVDGRLIVVELEKLVDAFAAPMKPGREVVVRVTETVAEEATADSISVDVDASWPGTIDCFGAISCDVVPADGDETEVPGVKEPVMGVARMETAAGLVITIPPGVLLAWTVATGVLVVAKPVVAVICADALFRIAGAVAEIFITVVVERSVDEAMHPPGRVPVQKVAAAVGPAAHPM
jgi:hypothetical protein